MKKELTLVEETTVNRYKTALEQCWEIATDNLITGDNKAMMIRDVSRSSLDREPTTADEYNEEWLETNMEINDDLIEDLARTLELVTNKCNCNDGLAEKVGLDWWYIHKLNRRVQKSLYNKE